MTNAPAPTPSPTPTAAPTPAPKLSASRTFTSVLLDGLGVIGRIVVVILFCVLVLLIPTWLENAKIILQTNFVDYLTVMLLGALVGFVEIVSRYQDAPFRTALTWPGMLYMVINALVAAAALWLIRLFGMELTLTTGTVTSTDTTRWTQVLTAGLGAMAIFRSSLFVLGKEGSEVSVGPSAVLQILLAAIDREVDRQRGQARARIIGNLKNVAYDSVKGELLLLSQRLMQNLSDAERKAIVEAIREIEVESTDPEVRKYMLGLKIIEFVGPDVLEQAIGIRGDKYYNDIYAASKPQEKASFSELVQAFSVGANPNPTPNPFPTQTGGTALESLSISGDEPVAKG